MKKLLILKMGSFFPKFVRIRNYSSTQMQFKGRYLVAITVATLIANLDTAVETYYQNYLIE